MPASNLSRVWAPNIFVLDPPDASKIMEFTRKSNAILQIIITHCDIIFTSVIFKIFFILISEDHSSRSCRLQHERYPN